MNRLIICAMILMLTACGDENKFGRTPPEAYLDWRDRLVARTGWPMFGREAPCVKPIPEVLHENWDVEEYWLPIQQCVRMSEPKRWRGIMALGEEMRKFCEGETTQCDRSQPGEKVWLSFTKEGWEQRADVGAGIYRVEFVGRKTIFPGSFGHLSGYDAEIVVDRLVSIKKLPGGEDPELLAVKARRD